MDSNWLEGLQSIYQLSNPITLLELLTFARADVLMKRNEAGSPAALGLSRVTRWIPAFCGGALSCCLKAGGWFTVFDFCVFFRWCEDWPEGWRHHSQTKSPVPESQRRTGADNLTTFTTLSCTMQTVHFMNCRLYRIEHLSVILFRYADEYAVTGLCIDFLFFLRVVWDFVLSVDFTGNQTVTFLFVIPLLCTIEPWFATVCQ